MKARIFIVLAFLALAASDLLIAQQLRRQAAAARLQAEVTRELATHVVQRGPVPALPTVDDVCRRRTEYLRTVLQIVVSESDTNRVDLPRPDPWVQWPAIVVPTERKAAGR